MRRELFFSLYINTYSWCCFFWKKFLRPRPSPFHLSFPVRDVNTSTRTCAREVGIKSEIFIVLSTKRTVTRFPTCVSKKRAQTRRAYLHTHTHTQLARNYAQNALLFLSSSCRVGECCQRFLFFFFFCDDDVSTTTTTTTKFASTWLGINFDFDFPKLRVLVRGHRWRHALGNNPNR